MWSVCLGKQVNALRTSQASGSRIARRLGIGLLVLTSIVAAPTFAQSSRSTPAKTPQQIFAQDSPSIVVVVAYDASGNPAELGSGVVIAQGQVVTNCHVVKKGVTLRVKQNGSQYPATVRYADADRDLCQLSVPRLTAPSIVMGDANTLQPGADVVAIGAPEGLELTISSGLVSSLRDLGDGTKIIQTTAAISPGSSGGGLFDDQGRLVGITAAQSEEGQNLNFALPANWIAKLPGHPVTFQTAETSLVYWVTTISAFENKKDWNAVLDHARRWVHVKPQEGLAWDTLGEAYENLNQLAAAKTAYEQAVKLAPSFEWAWKSLGQTYFALHQYAAANSAFERAIKLNPNDEKAWLRLGGNYFFLHQYDAAKSTIEQAIKLNPNDEGAWMLLGASDWASGRCAAAQSELEQATMLDSNDAGAWWFLGSTYHCQGNRDGVIEAYKHLRMLNSKLADKLFNSAILPQ